MGFFDKIFGGNQPKSTNAKCPNCNNYGRASDFSETLNQPLKFNDEGEPVMENTDGFAFRQRGQIEGHPVWICNNRNIAGVLMNLIDYLYKPITGDAFQDLKEDWESRTGSKF